MGFSGDTKVGGVDVWGWSAHLDSTWSAELCIGCGACTQVCPTLEDRDGVRRTIITGTVVREQRAQLHRMRCTDADARAPRMHPGGRPPDHMAALLIASSASRAQAAEPIVPVGSTPCDGEGDRNRDDVRASPRMDRLSIPRIRPPVTRCVLLGGVMKAVTVQPGAADSVRFEDVPEPDESTGSILVEAVAVGICGTDIEITSGTYGWAPPGRERLILGHESLGRVVDPGPGPQPATG